MLDYPPHITLGKSTAVHGTCIVADFACVAVYNKGPKGKPKTLHKDKVRELLSHYITAGLRMYSRVSLRHNPSLIHCLLQKRPPDVPLQ